MPIISIINNKGGVGKTTITQNLAIYFAQKGFTTGLIDFDSQANLSFSIPHTPNLDLVSLIQKRQPVGKSEFSQTEYENLYILPNEKDINSSVFNQFNTGDQPFVFKDIISQTKDFDYIFIDTAPALDIPTFNALVASDYLIIPVEHDIFSAIGLSILYDNIKSAQRLNPKLQVLGILQTQVTERSKMKKEMQEPLEKNFGKVVFETQIRTNVKFRQAQAERKDIFAYEKVTDDQKKFLGIKIGKPENKGSEDMENLSNEIINRINTSTK
jgi:chromosome partitioning protein